MRPVVSLPYVSGHVYTCRRITFVDEADAGSPCCSCASHTSSTTAVRLSCNRDGLCRGRKARAHNCCLIGGSMQASSVYRSTTHSCHLLTLHLPPSLTHAVLARCGLRRSLRSAACAAVKLQALSRSSLGSIRSTSQMTAGAQKHFLLTSCDAVHWLHFTMPKF